MNGLDYRNPLRLLKHVETLAADGYGALIAPIILSTYWPGPIV